MLSYLRRHHLGLIALFFALTGTSYAVATGSIDSREIRNNSVRSKDVRNNVLRSRDVRNNVLRSVDVREGTLTGTDVFDGGLTGADLANSSVEGVDVRDGTVRDADLGRNSVSSDELTNNAVRSAEVLNGSLGAQDLQGGLLASDANVRLTRFAVPPRPQPVGAQAGCPTGQRALGGGVSFGSLNDGDRVVFSEPRVGADAPNAQGAIANGWGAAILNGADEQRSATVWVVCAAR